MESKKKNEDRLNHIRFCNVRDRDDRYVRIVRMRRRPRHLKKKFFKRPNVTVAIFYFDFLGYNKSLNSVVLSFIP